MQFESGLLRSSAGRPRGEVHHSPTYSLRDVHDLEIRLVSQIVDLSPEHRHTASSLNETELFPSFHSSSAGNLAVPGYRIKQYNLFCFVVVGSVSVGIDSTSEVTGS